MAVIDFDRDRNKLRSVASSLEGGGGSGYDGGMEARVAKLEASVSHIERDVSDLRSEMRQMRADMRQDFRLTWGGIIGVALGLTALLAKGFHWIG